MPPVFYRYEPSLLETHLLRWESLPFYPRQAMAWNLRYDHRVPAWREADLTGFVVQAEEPGVDPLNKGLRDYHEKTVQGTDQPSFLTGNDGNFVRKLHPHYPLGTVIDLTSISTTMAQAARDKNPAFAKFRLEDQVAYTPGAGSAALWNSFLRQRFWNAGEDARREFLDDLFYALYTQRRHPVWVTNWDALAPVLGHSDARCLEVLGMPRTECPRFLIALRYEARDAGILVRPTQLDAGDAAYHYPSPPNRPLLEGGTTMHLAMPRPNDLLVPEYIHAQILFRTDFWAAANHWRREIFGPVACALPAARKQHQNVLSGTYGSHKPPWMEEFPPV